MNLIHIYAPMDIFNHVVDAILYGKTEKDGSVAVCYVTSTKGNSGHSHEKNKEAGALSHQDVIIGFLTSEARRSRISTVVNGMPKNDIFVVMDTSGGDVVVLDVFMNGIELDSVDITCSLYSPTDFLVSQGPFEQLLKEQSPVICSFFCQLYSKVRQLSSAMRDLTGRFRIRGINFVACTALDVMMGYWIVQYLQNLFTERDLLDFFLLCADSVVSYLQNVLNWIMGVPVGLKLNAPLNSALGNFFLYHIYLWKTYIVVIRPMLLWLFGVMITMGHMGVSFQICILRDLLALATFHVYCFYVYAARLYNLLVAALASLWRLFRGKKWNPLRERVDSCSYDVDQLFVGTLGFTVLLFLLPTALVYYIVFASLRMIILCLEGALSRICYLLNVLPLQTILLWFCRSPQLAGGIRLEPLSRSTTSLRYSQVNLRIQVVVDGFWHALSSSVPIVFPRHEALPWKDVLHSLIIGKIIYPL
ncbi:unnamed protein product [Darwinula stevensoni]|uniref:Phosphatidylinositol N-acetylglucosaminyltransferase subunit Q n=1 Tax=Darwinula stevensoni TaxID=69355 RepID=A0A7R8XEH7_9CRUS|nr:unnamed protein product [Darwinula stevensoni]CAG0889697.1 unnamed protein product [Darwinula stevensoni]